VLLYASFPLYTSRIPVCVRESVVESHNLRVMNVERDYIASTATSLEFLPATRHIEWFDQSKCNSNANAPLFRSELRSEYTGNARSDLNQRDGGIEQHL